MTACRYEVKPFSTLQRWHKHTAPLDTRWTHEGGNPQVGSVPVPAEATSRCHQFTGWKLTGRKLTGWCIALQDLGPGWLDG